MSRDKFRCPPQWTLRQRLDHYSVPNANTGCILWVGNTAKNGYGMLNWERRAWLAASRPA